MQTFLSNSSFFFYFTKKLRCKNLGVLTLNKQQKKIHYLVISNALKIWKHRKHWFFFFPFLFFPNTKKKKKFLSITLNFSMWKSIYFTCKWALLLKRHWKILIFFFSGKTFATSKMQVSVCMHSIYLRILQKFKHMQLCPILLGP